jgi:autotransporter-associated beta strand protein
VTLTGTNSFAGNVVVSSGGLKIFNAAALGTGPKTIVLTNGTAGRPQLYLDGSGGDITLPADFSFQTSNQAQSHPAISNLAGNNVIGGNILPPPAAAAPTSTWPAAA